MSSTVRNDVHSRSRRIGPIVTASLLAVAAAFLPNQARAQQAQLDLHGNLAIGTSTHNKSWGGGAALPLTVGTGPVKVTLSPGVDYMKQENDGPTQTTVAADLTAQPGGNSPVTPYAGVSVGANWSGGDNKQWEGARIGMETLAGLQVKFGASRLSGKAEERFGYVKGQEHTLTTRLGVLISF